LPGRAGTKPLDPISDCGAALNEVLTACQLVREGKGREGGCVNKHHDRNRRPSGEWIASGSSSSSSYYYYYYFYFYYYYYYYYYSFHHHHPIHHQLHHQQRLALPPYPHRQQQLNPRQKTLLRGFYYPIIITLLNYYPPLSTPTQAHRQHQRWYSQDQQDNGSPAASSPEHPKQAPVLALLYSPPPHPVHPGYNASC